MRAFLPILVVLALLVGFRNGDDRDSFDRDPGPSSSLLFVADTGGHEDAYGTIAASAALLDWGATIIAPVAGADVSAFEVLADVSDSYNVLQDLAPTADAFELVDLDDLTIIILDRQPSDLARCQLDEALITDVVSVVGQSSKPIVVVSDFPFWRGVEPPPDQEELILEPSNLVNCEGSDSVIDLFGRLPEDHEVLFLSRQGNGVYDRKLDDLRFVQLGTPERSVSASLTFLRIGVSDGKLIVGEMKQANPNLQEPAVLDRLPRYDISVDEDDLRALYNASPFYDRRAGWPELLEDREFELPRVDAEITYAGETYEGSIRTRGSFGNHWSDIKKSWTVDIAEPGIDGRTQLKFILPYDRLYINQLFVQEINTSGVVDVISPSQSVGRMVLNDRDFGPYLIYEDFDDVFIELRGFNSGTQRAGLLYRDLFGLYDIWDDPNFITASKNRQDKSRFMPAMKVPAGYSEFSRYFEPANYRPWIASQLFTGDPHQNAQNNTRFFPDLSTGRFIMVSWDQFFARIESVDDIDNFNPTSTLQFEILKYEEDEVLDIVGELIDNTDAFEWSLAKLRSEYIPMFQNDPYLQHTEQRIDAFAESLSDNLKNNVEKLTAYVASR